MPTPSIYTIGQLKAYLAGAAATLDAMQPAPNDTITWGSVGKAVPVAIREGRMAAFREVIALIEGIEAYERQACIDLFKQSGLVASGRDAVVALGQGGSPADIAASQGQEYVTVSPARIHEGTLRTPKLEGGDNEA